ncbi:MAG: DUF2384 domain-containing protein [Verrucomicrobiota bacterium]|nr:DUF2384 domain-containing protein [Verrucomicrobiota bacterium]
MKATAVKAVSKKDSAATRSASVKNGASAAHDLIRNVQAGLKFAEVEALRRDLDLPLDRLAETLGIARATLHRRKSAGRLAPDESDKVVRFARIFHQAEEVFGTADRAREWLAFPQYGLGGAVPLDYARTEVGAREVEDLLGRIEYSVYG